MSATSPASDVAVDTRLQRVRGARIGPRLTPRVRARDNDTLRARWRLTCFLLTNDSTLTGSPSNSRAGPPRRRSRRSASTCATSWCAPRTAWCSPSPKGRGSPVTPGATIRYTVNNTAVQSNSTIYTAPLTFAVTTTLRFKAFHVDYSPSAEVTRTYTLAPAAPVFTPTGGSYVAGQQVTITAPTSGSTIRYTITGAEPTTSDPTIASGGALVVGNYTLKAKAWKTGTNPSATTSATYAITGTFLRALKASSW